MKKLLICIVVLLITGCDIFMPSDLKRFYAIEEKIEVSYSSGQLSEAGALANEYLTLAKKFPNDWNYGNAIHKANLYKGLIALKEGNLEAAKGHLKAAGNTPGSPQLDTFGPNMLLAKALLEKGEQQAVLEYIEQLHAFWEMNDGKLDQWSEQIKRGETPDFGANLAY